MCVLRLCQWLKDELSLAVITNDIYTREDAEFLLRANILPADRVIGVETGGCPHTAIRDDTSMNQAAVTELEKRHPDLRLILIESGGDNLSATFSPELVDAYIFVIDVAEGDKIPRKGGPAIRNSARVGCGRARTLCRCDATMSSKAGAVSETVAVASGASAAGVRVMGRDPAERALALESLGRWPGLDKEDRKSVV